VSPCESSGACSSLRRASLTTDMSAQGSDTAAPSTNGNPTLTPPNEKSPAGKKEAEKEDEKKKDDQQQAGGAPEQPQLPPGCVQCEIPSNTQTLQFGGPAFSIAGRVAVRSLRLPKQAGVEFCCGKKYSPKTGGNASLYLGAILVSVAAQRGGRSKVEFVVSDVSAAGEKHALSLTGTNALLPGSAVAPAEPEREAATQAVDHWLVEEANKPVVPRSSRRSSLEEEAIEFGRSSSRRSSSNAVPTSPATVIVQTTPAPTSSSSDSEHDTHLLQTLVSNLANTRTVVGKKIKVISENEKHLEKVVAALQTQVEADHALLLKQQQRHTTRSRSRGKAKPQRSDSDEEEDEPSGGEDDENDEQISESSKAKGGKTKGKKKKNIPVKPRREDRWSTASAQQPLPPALMPFPFAPYPGMFGYNYGGAGYPPSPTSSALPASAPMPIPPFPFSPYGAYPPGPYMMPPRT
jgi:hypothetical protein